MVREFTNKSNRIREQERQVLNCYFAHSGIQRGKEFVFSENLRLANQVHDGGLAHVGIADKCYTHHLATVLALRSHLAVNLFQFLTEQSNTLSDDSFIRLNLCLTHTTAGGTTSALTVKVRPHTGQTRQHILQMRHLYLRLSIGGLCTVQENLKNEDSAVNDTNGLFVVVLNLVLIVRIERFLYVAELARR